MCIAIAKQAGVAITESILRNCFENNPDGAGFCVEVDGQLKINKGYFTFEDFYAAYQPYEYQKSLIHFRIRTHGNVDVDNCHPFVVTDDVAFIHNGIISNVTAKGSESDTIVFNKLYLQPIVAKYGQEALTSTALKNLIENFIGFSKLAVFVKGQEDFIFFNESMGNRSKEGIWFSNYSWQNTKTYTPPPKKDKTETNLPIPFHEKTTEERKEIDFLSLRDGSTFCFGTLVEVSFPINHTTGTIPKGAIGEIDCVYNDRTVDVDFYMEGKVKSIYPYALKVLPDPYNFEALNNHNYSA